MIASIAPEALISFWIWNAVKESIQHVRKYGPVGHGSHEQRD
jgi:hypothetical protein